MQFSGLSAIKTRMQSIMYSWLIKSGSIIALKTKFLRINYLFKFFFYLIIVKTVVANL